VPDLHAVRAFDAEVIRRTFRSLRFHDRSLPANATYRASMQVMLRRSFPT